MDKVTGVASIILGHLEFEPDYTIADARRVNDSDTGWTIETSAPLGNVVRHENVFLSDEDLDKAYKLAERWAANNEIKSRI